MTLNVQTQTQSQLQIKPKKIQEKGFPHIIIVDDDIELLQELKDAFSSHYQVDTLSNSAEAFNMVNELMPDLIVMDIKMSPKTGFQLANEFRNSERTKSIPIIAITGIYVEKEHSLMMKLFGMKHIIIKPFHFEQLFEEIEAILNEYKPNWN